MVILEINSGNFMGEHVHVGRSRGSRLYADFSHLGNVVQSGETNAKGLTMKKFQTIKCLMT